MGSCMICPRSCGVNRNIGEKGYCGETDKIRIARAALHFWEEPCISGDTGSGTVFFTGCNLGCVYCQNYDIAHEGRGKEVTIERLSEIYLELEDKGAANINLVTPTHFSPQIKQAIIRSKSKGLNIPIVYNTSSYETVESLRDLAGVVDIYLSDFKYFDGLLAKKYSNAPDYPEIASKAFDEMISQQPELVFNDNGILLSGVIARHLVLPGQQEDSKKILEYLYLRYGDSILISIMNQFTPSAPLISWPEINRVLDDEEYQQVIDYALELGISNGYIQEGETAKESFIPPFDNEGV
ncbi:radical SAM protein [Gudongella oleilytica]|uniref:radical SAM protein n=1 Tax=Gudongella oleilytica TaxID=1582259 RepID=UPI000EC25AB2|nr:radical SAM protein [Gudongella oleilytica]MDY0256012.1 radical SAM protein [Gudongella oleilytica]HCO19012.1 radical SAM protein [Tissierellales bacterium]